MAGLALFVSLAACGDSTGTRGPDVPSEGEAAALMDAEAMLDERPAEPEPDATADSND